MRVGILETGAPPRELQGRFGRYDAMFAALLKNGGYDWTNFNVRAGDLPPRPESCDAYVVTGSPAAAYDRDGWIAQTRDFLRQAKGRAALVGVCFGHQLMADAFGGRVEKSAKGWGIGLHRYEIIERRPWMDGVDHVSAPASHQDQVVEAPPHSIVIGGNDFTPMGMLAYADQPAISIQLHPEFEPAFAVALIEGRRGSLFPEARADEAVAELAEPNDNDRLAAWIERFLADCRARI